MDHITQYRATIKRDGWLYSAVLSEAFYIGNRLHWRVTYADEIGRTFKREYVTSRILVDGQLVIEGTKR